MMYTHRLHALIAAAAAAVLFAACASKSGKVTEESAGSVAASSSTALSGALAPASALIGGPHAGAGDRRRRFRVCAREGENAE
jgi:hypothetical protein